MAEVVAQLLDVRDRLAAAAVTAMRASADAEQAHGHYTEAAQGTKHSQIQEAITDVRMAGEKSAKAARMLDHAKERFTAYLNTVAPGSIPDQDVSDRAMPSGERLLKEADQRSGAQRSAAAFLQKAVRNTENIQDTAKTATELGEKGLKILRTFSRPPSTQSTGTQSSPTATLPGARPKIDMPDAVSQMLVLGLIVSVAAQKADQLIRRGIARLRTRERTDRA